MKTSEIYRRVHENGESIPVKITATGQCCWNDGPDEGMVADLICMDEVQNGESVMRVVCDFSPYRAYNEKIAKTDWLVPNTGHIGATWFTSGYYPEDGKLEGYITAALNDECDNDCFEIIQNPELFQYKMVELTPALEQLIAYAMNHIAKEKETLSPDVFNKNYGELEAAAAGIYPQLSRETKELLNGRYQNKQSDTNP